MTTVRRTRTKHKLGDMMIMMSMAIFEPKQKTMIVDTNVGNVYRCGESDNEETKMEMVRLHVNEINDSVWGEQRMEPSEMESSSLRAPIGCEICTNGRVGWQEMVNRRAVGNRVGSGSRF